MIIGIDPDIDKSGDENMICITCGIDKSLTDFYKSKTSKCGYRGVCKACQSEKNKKLYSEKKELIKNRSRNYRNENRDEISNKLKCKRNANLEFFRKRERHYYNINKEQKLAEKRKYYLKNKQKIAEQRKRYRELNLLKIRIINGKRRALKRKAGGFFTKNDIEKILLEQKGRCVYCKINIKKKYSIDHIKPLKLGGWNNKENIQLLCKSCNSKKSAKDQFKFANELGMLL